MKLRSLIAAGTIATLGIGITPSVANAGPGDTTVTFTLSNGSLSVAVADGAVDLGTKTPNSLNQISGNLDATTVTDNRNSTTGWTAYSYSDDFAKSGGGATIPDDNVNVSVSLANAASATVQGTNLTALQIAGIFTPTPGGAAGNATHSDGGSTVDGGSIGVLVSASLTTLLQSLPLGLGGGANHTFSFTPTITITVPADTPNGTYSGIVYQTVS